MQSFTDLNVWKKALDLLAEVHAITDAFRTDEQYELKKQLRASTKSVVANLAEGCGRYTFRDKANKFVIARGECTEVRAHLLVAIRLNYVSAQRAAHALALTTEVGKMLSGLINSCRRREQITNNQ